jgi:signal transduction histidine kinase
MRPVPVRIRLTVGFAAVMAVLLAGAGAYMHSRVAADLNTGIDGALRARVADLTALVEQSESGLRDARAEGIEQTDFAQVVDRHGRVFDATAGLRRHVLLDGRALRTARTKFLWIDHAHVPGLPGPARLLAAPVSAQDRHLIVIAGASLAARDRALDRVTGVMLVGGPALLLLASLAGYALAALALRPVERMRVRAEGIWTHGLHSRLPRTGARDELDRLAATLNESLDRVESGVQREQGFVADASHELRTPLTVLRAELELLGSGPEVSTEELRAEITSAIEEVDRLAELADDLLLLARADGAELEVSAEPIRVGPVLERIGRRLAVLDTGTIEVVEPDPELWVRASEPRLEQALLNIAENALRHGNGWARIEAHRAGDDVEVHVLDDGPGFPGGFAGSAFDRFSRGERARTGDGAGLGLAIVRAIAEAHGGRAGAANRPGAGADVWLSLPAVEVSAQPPWKLSAQSSDGR